MVSPVSSPITARRIAEVEEISPLSSFFEKIIDKKVNQVALTIFERFVDFLCTYFYASYNERLTFRLKELDLEEVKEEKEVDDTDKMPRTAEKVHHFFDGAPLYDRTNAQRTSIERGGRFGLDEIKIDDKRVMFTTNLTSVLAFGAKYGTKEVFVTDTKECPELVIIYERETSNNLKAWIVNTAHPTKKIIMGGALEIAREDVFLAQEIDLQTTPAPIISTFP